MKLHLLFLFAVSITVPLSSAAQTAIGSTTPHPSALVDMASTTKGLLVPRMTPAQITALATTAANGLLVYDSVNRVLKYYKTGSGWREVARLTLPYSDTANSAAEAFKITNTGSGSGITGINAGTAYANGVEGLITNASNTSNSSAGVFGYNAGAGPGVYGVAGSDAGVLGESSAGIGTKGASSTGPGVYGTTNSGIGVQGVSGAGPGVYGNSTSGTGIMAASTSGTAFYASSVTGAGGNFTLTGTSNANTALASTTLGTGIGLLVNCTNAANSSNGVSVFHAGSGVGGLFSLSASSNTADALYAVTNGSGKALHAKSNTGYAGYFENTNAANSVPTLSVNTNTSNYAVSVTQSSATGSGVYIQTQPGARAININRGRITHATASITGGTIPADVTMVVVDDGQFGTTASVALPASGIDNGNIIIVAAADLNGVTVTGTLSGNITVNYGVARQFIRVGGSWYVEY